MKIKVKLSSVVNLEIWPTLTVDPFEAFIKRTCSTWTLCASHKTLHLLKMSVHLLWSIPKNLVSMVLDLICSNWDLNVQASAKQSWWTWTFWGHQCAIGIVCFPLVKVINRVSVFSLQIKVLTSQTEPFILPTQLGASPPMNLWLMWRSLSQNFSIFRSF